MLPQAKIGWRKQEADEGVTPTIMAGVGMGMVRRERKGVRGDKEGRNC